jgi:hypothetical protein
VCRLAALALVLVACRHHDARPLGQAIVGTWDELCTTDREDASSCPGTADMPLQKTFEPDGTVAVGATGHGDTPMVGTWTVHDAELDVEFRAAAIVEEYRARIDGDQLVLWYAKGGFGSIYHRHGTPAVTAALATSSGGPTAGALDGVKYTIDLPAGYRLTRNDNHRQRWSPPDQGLEVRISVTPRSKQVVDGTSVSAPCPTGDPPIGGASETIGGVERETDVMLDYCLDPDRAMMCSVGHTRGYLEPGERDAAIALCRHLAFVH